MIKDTHRENTPSNKTHVLTKTVIIDIWVVGTLNQLFVIGCYTQIYLKKKILVAKIYPLQYVHIVHYILFALSLAFDREVLYENVAILIFGTFNCKTVFHFC